MPQHEIDATGAASDTGTESANDTGTESPSDAGAAPASGAVTDPATYPSERVCPECDAPCVVRDGGCPTCRACGWSKCAYTPP